MSQACRPAHPTPARKKDPVTPVLPPLTVSTSTARGVAGLLPTKTDRAAQGYRSYTVACRYTVQLSLDMTSRTGSVCALEGGHRQPAERMNISNCKSHCQHFRHLKKNTTRSCRIQNQKQIWDRDCVQARVSWEPLELTNPSHFGRRSLHAQEASSIDDSQWDHDCRFQMQNVAQTRFGPP